MLNRRNLTTGAVLAPLTLVNCTPKAVAQETEFKSDGIDLHDVDHSLMPFGATTSYAVRDGEGFDEEGVRLNLRGGEWQDNPVTQSQYGMMLLSAYREQGWEENLEIAIANGRRIHTNSEIIDGRAYFPYGFPMPLFGRDDMVLDPPWYSGMAQGQVLQFYSQLFEITGDQFWQEAAAEVFESFRDVMNKDLPWWPNVDEKQNLWFEEYPFDPEQHVFNGHVFALAGTYEYWRATGDKWAEQLTKGAIRTILDRKDDFRVEGELSRYALGQPVQHDTYHSVHINQLLFLYALTRDDRFAQTADHFADDWDMTSTVGTMVLDPGEYNTPEPESVGSLLYMGEDQPTVFESPMELQVTTRRTAMGSKRVYYHVEAEGQEPFWLEETESSLLRGMYLGSLLFAGTSRGTLLSYHPVRSMTLGRGEYRAHPNGSDYTADPETVEVTEDLQVEVAARALITAEPYVLTTIESGAEYWIEWGDHFAPRI